MEPSAIALGVLSTAVVGLLGFSYFQNSAIGEAKEYKEQACRGLFNQNRIINESDLNTRLKRPIQTASDQKEHDQLEDCRRSLFPRRWFGGKRTRKVRKDTFMSRRR